MGLETKEEANPELGTSSIPSLILKFSLPSIVGMLVSALYNVVDRIFIGQGVGPLGLAGATIAFPLMQVQIAFASLIGMGATTLISIELGRQDRARAERVLGNGFALVITVALSVSVLGLVFLDPLLRLFGASEAVLPYARDYTGVILAGTIFQVLALGVNNFIRGEGNPRTAMVSMFIGAVLNAILCPIFLFALRLGMKGAALATVLSQAVSAAWVMSHYLSGRSILKLRLADMRPRRDIVFPILAIGSAPFAVNLANAMMNGIMNNQLQRYGGDLAVSAMGAVFAIVSLFVFVAFGINGGVQPIIGYNYGAGRSSRVRHAALLAIGAAVAVFTLGYAVVQLFPRTLVSLFTGGSRELTDLSAGALRRVLLCMPLIGFQIVASGYFQAVGKPRHSMFLSVSRSILFLIPLLYVMPAIVGLQGLWLAPPTADFLAAVVTAFFFGREMRSLSSASQGTILEMTGR
jgi:putative MATE family efflux protein